MDAAARVRVVARLGAQDSDGLDSGVILEAASRLDGGLGNGALLALDLLDLGRGRVGLGQGVRRLAVLHVREAREIVVVKVAKSIELVCAG
jgi:hypothetical protein